MLVGGVTAGDFRQFPGVVDAIQRADLSFRIQLRRAIEPGKESYQAILDSAVSRMRPVLMAASTTILGMIPVLYVIFFRVKTNEQVVWFQRRGAENAKVSIVFERPHVIQSTAVGCAVRTMDSPFSQLFWCARRTLRSFIAGCSEKTAAEAAIFHKHAPLSQLGNYREYRNRLVIIMVLATTVSAAMTMVIAMTTTFTVQLLVQILAADAAFDHSCFIRTRIRIDIFFNRARKEDMSLQ
jgi:hypothetical protein